jgi:hypothetical protein
MKRNPVFLAASAAELVRNTLLAFAAYDTGIAAGDFRASVFRYASSAQLLCALGFFFLWLDRRRYCQFERLLAVAKIMSVVLIAAPFFASLFFGQKYWISFDAQLAGPAVYIAIAAIDVFGLSVLFLTRPSPDSGLDPAEG